MQLARLTPRLENPGSINRNIGTHFALHEEKGDDTSELHRE